MADPALAVSERQTPTPAIERILRLLATPVEPAEADIAHGYLDLLGRQDPTGAHLGQRLMLSRVLPLIYQRFWRPLGGRLLMGVTGPSTGEEHRMALEMLSIAPGDQVLDVACGPGNFTPDFAPAAGDGLVAAHVGHVVALGVANGGLQHRGRGIEADDEAVARGRGEVGREVAGAAGDVEHLV